jgi:hypothetical protein
MRKTADPHWRGNRAIKWIEDYCRVPVGFNKGARVHLSPEQRQIICSIYDGDSGSSEPITGHLAAYLSLLHLCGPEATKKDFPAPPVEVDSFTVWSAAQSAELQAVLRRNGELIACPELGTTFPRGRAAA